ncbi:MAG: addiction module protein [Balneolaceae bacterium]|nr:addiction module protein [Balneolaceae bacterium]
MKTKELKDAISYLPIDQRIEIAEYVLETLNRPDPEVEEAWLEEIERREKKYQEGKATLIPGEKVISAIRERLAK